MRKIAIYFHGYGSNANSEKTRKLKESGLETYSWDIDIDPEVSVPFLENKILDLVLDRINEDIALVFIGTSLGGWYASKLAERFKSKNVFLINPSYCPRESLKKYNVEESICEKYDDLEFKDFHKVYIGSNDAVIDFTDVDFNGADYHLISGADHRFAEHFPIVINDLTSSV
jgi:predicted esterase YcpF (UPF0227 family)